MARGRLSALGALGVVVGLAVPAAAQEAAPVAAPVAAPSAAAGPEAAPAIQPIQVVAQVSVGRWPEGVAVQGRTAWVAISGERQLSAVDLDQAKVIQHQSVGRLPVEVEASASGIYAQSHTDQTLWAVRSPGAKAALKLMQTARCPEDLALGEHEAFVLHWPDCASKTARVVRLPLKGAPKGARPAASPTLPGAGWALARAHGALWVVFDEGRLVRLDPATLQPTGEAKLAGSPMGVRAGAQGLYVFGRTAELQRVDPATLAVAATVTLPARPTAVAAAEDGIWASLDGGELVRLDPQRLAVQARYASPAPGLAARALVRDGDRWLMTSHQAVGGGDETGTLWIVKAAAP